MHIAVITALAFTVVIPLVSFFVAIARDAAGEAEWAAIDHAWRSGGGDIVAALRADLYRRSDMLGANGRGKS